MGDRIRGIEMFLKARLDRRLDLVDAGHLTLYLRAGLNVIHGKVTYEQVAQDLGYDYVTAVSALGI